MPFPTDDRAWNDTLLYLLERRRPGERTLAPDEFADELPFVRAYSQREDGDEPAYAWVVVHKGMIASLEMGFLQQLSSWSVPVFANEVFVVFAREPGFTMSDLSDSDHVKSFYNALPSAEAPPPAEKPAVPPSAPEPEPVVEAPPPPPAPAVAARPPAQPPAAPPPPPPAEPPAPEPARPAVEARTDRLATNQGDGALHRLRQQETLRLMAEYLGDLEGQRVLDLGCGAGRFALPLVKAEVLGVDAASDLIENARARHAGLSNFRFLAADPARLELAEQPFDVTLLVDALAAADEGAAALLASAAAHTRPGGLLFLSVDNRDALDRRAARRMGGVPRGAGGSHGLTQAETTSMVRAAGFRPLRCDGVVLPWGSALGADNDEILEALRELGRLAGPAYAQGIVMLARKG